MACIDRIGGPDRTEPGPGRAGGGIALALALALLVGRDVLIGARAGCRVADATDAAGVLRVRTAGLAMVNFEGFVDFAGIVDFGLRVDVVVVVLGAKRAFGGAVPALPDSAPAAAGSLEGFVVVIADLAGRRKSGSSISSLALNNQLVNVTA